VGATHPYKDARLEKMIVARVSRASGFRTSSVAQVEPRYGARRATSAIPENKMTPAPLATVRGLARKEP